MTVIFTLIEFIAEILGDFVAYKDMKQIMPQKKDK